MEDCTLMDDAHQFLPLTPRVLHILLALLHGPQHGYRIMKDVEELSSGLVKIGPGTLYEAIHGLREKALIEPAASEGDARRRAYRLTELGRDVVAAETSRLADVVDYARSAAAGGTGTSR